MTFEGPVLAWLTLALVPIVLPILLALILALLRIRAGCLPLVLLAALVPLTVLGILAYLDSGGTVVTGEVLDKKELIIYHLDSSWNRKLIAEVRYTSSDTALPNTATLHLLPAPFDDMHQGDFVQLRFSNLAGGLSISRLEGQKTLSYAWSWATNQPFLMLFVSGLLLVLAARFIAPLSLPILFFVGALITVGAWWFANVIVPLWQQSDTLMGSLNTVSANVREVHPPYLGSGLQGWMDTKLFTPYDLILLELTPLGRSQPVQSVDAVDVGSTDLRTGQSLNVQYSAGNPRFAVIPDATRNYLWKNGLLRTLFSLVILAGVGLVAFFLQGKSREHEDEF